MKPSVAAFTLGCKVNQYDTEAILNDFAKIGYTICNFEEKADVYIINTCTVTNVSNKKSRQMIGRAYRQNPKALVVAYGCLAQVQPDSLKNIEGVSVVLGTDKKSQIAEIVTELLKYNPNPQKVPIIRKDRTRAYLKIQDGCDQYCSYCIVPYARGSIKSRPMPEIIEEAEALLNAGYKEIVITGIQIASYGKDLDNGENIATLMKKIHDLKGLARLRLGSLEPNMINEEFLSIAATLPNLCDHFHLSLQSGCDKTLKEMNRKYTTADYTKVVTQLLNLFPNAAFTTDIIVGFPGETEADFKESLEFVKKIKFFRIHVFAYSQKEGTPAAEMPNQVAPKTKEQRSKTMREQGKELTKNFHEKQIGRTLPVLFESETNGMWEGHTSQYITIQTKATNVENKIIPIKLLEIRNETIYGKIQK